MNKLGLSLDDGERVDAQDVIEAVIMRDGEPVAMLVPYGERAHLTDREVAVTIDSLSQTRERLRDEGVETPTIDAVLQKITVLITPTTDGLTITADG